VGAGLDDGGFVALSKFAVVPEDAERVKAAFRARPHLVDGAPGFVRLEVLVPAERPNEFWLVTHWRNRESYEQWYASHAYHDVHEAMPHGLKLIRGSAEVLLFERVAR
jgi:heme-degrading monooxygenase HmoA